MKKIVSCLLFLCVVSVFADVVVLKDSHDIEYSAIFSMDENGITLQVENGLRHVGWELLSEEDANRLSGGKHLEYIEKARQKEMAHAAAKAQRESKIEEAQKKQLVQKKKVVKKEQKNNKKGSELEKFLGGASMKSAPSTTALENMLDPNDSIWRFSPKKFLSQYPDFSFSWISTSGKKDLRSTNSKVSFLSLEIIETLAQFKGKKLQRLIISFYNRGDAGDITERTFTNKIELATEKITSWIKKEYVQIEDDKRAGGIHVKNRIWVKKPYRYDLEYASTKKSNAAFRAEFMRLKITRAKKTYDPHQTVIARFKDRPDRLTFSSIQSHVQKEKNGDVLITGIPMVDQGEKGYCAVAAAERVLRYYGRDVDQHELAQIAQTSAQTGTRPDEMLSALRRIARKQEVQIKIHEKFDSDKFLKLLKKYNRAAKKTGKNEIHKTGMRFLKDIYKEMDKDLFRTIKTKQKAYMNRFKKDIACYCNVGIPLLWSVMTGMVSEDIPVTTVGGHARLIIGFNPKTKQILYTDTWGEGHELKRMRLDDAWAITTGLYTIEPSNWHYRSRGEREPGW